MPCQLSTSPGRIQNLTPSTTAEVCPEKACPEIETPKTPQKPSEWAKSAFNFHAEPKQAEVLDHPAHRLILCCPRQWGKSTLIALKALHYAIHNPQQEIVVLSDTEDHAGIIVQKLVTYAAALKLPRRRAHGKQYSIELPNGSKIFAVAHNMSSGVGYTANIVIVDEAALVNDEVIGYVSRTLARTNGRFWLLSTPRGQTGLFYAIWHDNGLNWHRVKATIEDAKYLDPQFVQEQKQLFPATFRQDFYCEFLQAPGRLFSKEKIARNVDPALNSRVMHNEDEESL